MSTYTIAAFYKFIELTDIAKMQIAIKKFAQSKDVLGTLLLAPEGINGTLAGTEDNINAMVAFLRSYTPFADLECKYSIYDVMPFQKIKVYFKKEIVTLGMPNINPEHKTGVHVAAEHWNDLISKPDVFVLDTRNTYEVELGTFKNAINPNTEYFRDFPRYVAEQLDPTQHKNIAMFCTGGIRCEKASAYLLEQGFENVYQLEGGILKYLEKTETENSLWEGKCFIFDDRIVLEKEAIKTS